MIYIPLPIISCGYDIYMYIYIYTHTYIHMYIYDIHVYIYGIHPNQYNINYTYMIYTPLPIISCGYVIIDPIPLDAGPPEVKVGGAARTPLGGSLLPPPLPPPPLPPPFPNWSFFLRCSGFACTASRGRSTPRPTSCASELSSFDIRNGSSGDR